LLTDYKFRKDEIFKRMKPTTFAQLVSVTVTSCVTQ